MSGYDDLAGLLTFRPLTETLPPPTYEGWRGSPFSASWTSTVNLLADELRHLGARQVLLEVDLREQDLRLDGMPRANARAGAPGVILTLIDVPVAQGQTLRYPCSTFHDWQANVRAIALALEALRKVDRYGVTRRGEQYAGWKALPAGSGPSASRGRQLIDQHGSVAAALRATHPDTSGYDSAADFADVQAARQEASHG